MKRVLSLCIVMQLFTTIVFCQKNPIDSLIKDFKGFMFEYKIQPARRALEIYEQAAIPKILPLMYNNSFTSISDNKSIVQDAERLEQIWSYNHK